MGTSDGRIRAAEDRVSGGAPLQRRRGDHPPNPAANGPILPIPHRRPAPRSRDGIQPAPCGLGDSRSHAALLPLYARAKRAKVCGYPERFAQEALGHNSKAVHRAYAKRAEVTLPSLDDYERQHEKGKIVPFSCPNAAGDDSVEARKPM